MLTSLRVNGTVTSMLFVQGIMGALQRLLARIPRGVSYQ